MAQSGKIKFFFPYRTSLAHRSGLKEFIKAVFRKEGKSLEELNYVFCSDKELLRINKDFLRHNYYTDIITFDLSESGRAIRGEIYISAERVRDNALKLGVSFKSELHRVIFHGVLHLCGYDDKNEKLSRIMRGKEDFYLNQYFK